jgi:alpha-1,6-mannosyltransferase
MVSLKICDIVQFYGECSGGVRRYLTDKSEYLSSQADVEHTVIVPARRDGRRALHRSVFHEVRSPPLIGSNCYRLLLSRRRIAGIVAQERPDIIEVGDPYVSAWIASGLARRRGIPIVAYYHSDFPRALPRALRRCGAWLEKPAARLANAYVRRLYNRMDATAVARGDLAGVLAGLGIRRVERVPLGVHPERFRPRDSRACVFARLGLPPDARLLLCVGRFGREKNLFALMAMLDALPRGSRPCRLALVGDGELRHALERQAARRRDVILLPFRADPESLSELYSAADLLVHAGTCETFGLVSLEAQACGTRVVAVRGGGLDSTLEGETPEVTAASAAPADLAAAVSRALAVEETPGSRERRRRRVIERFSSDRTHEAMLRLYRRLIAERAAGTTRGGGA